MSDATNIPDRLRQQASLLYAHAQQAQAQVRWRSETLDALIHDAQAREHRRAAFNARDASCYRLGAAFEPTDGPHLDPLALAGFLALGTTGLLFLVRTALGLPNASVSEQLAALFRSPAGDGIRAWGIWSRWCWLRALYVDQTQTFLASPAGQDPAARWRRNAPTAEQTYLIAEICFDLGLIAPSFLDRGAAFDWIEAQGGNTRFKSEPARPSLDDLARWLT